MIDQEIDELLKEIDNQIKKNESFGDFINSL